MRAVKPPEEVLVAERRAKDRVNPDSRPLAIAVPPRAAAGEEAALQSAERLRAVKAVEASGLEQAAGQLLPGLPTSGEELTGLTRREVQPPAATALKPPR